MKVRMMVSLFLRCVLLVFLLRAPCCADTHQPKIDLGPWAEGVKIQPGEKFAGKRLWGSEIVGQDLTGVSFDDCNLQHVALRQCKLQKATFRRAILDGFCLDDCELGDNDFTDAVLNGAMGLYRLRLTLEQFKSSWSYKNKDLSRCDFCVISNSNVPLDVDFRGFNLIKTRFHGLNLSQTSFEGATVLQVEFVGCHVRFAELLKSSISFSDCRFSGTEFLDDVDLSRKGLRQTVLRVREPFVPNLSDTEIWGMHASGWLTPAALRETKNFKDGQIGPCHFSKIDFSDFDFSGQLLFGTSFTKCDFNNADFEDAVISFARFHFCTGLTVEQIKSTWNYKHNRMKDIKLPDDIAVALEAAIDEE